ncbi:MAG: hypothetical protein AAFX93_14720 [Verrucomicrobiota bacterium]
MKRFIIKLIAISAIGAGVLWSLALVLDRQPYKDQNNVFFWALAHQDAHLDIAFVGSSRVANMIDPAAFDAVAGTRSINLGVGGGTAVDSYLLLKKFLEKNQVDAVILNIDYLTISNFFDLPFRASAWSLYLDDEEVYDAYQKIHGPNKASLLKYAPTIRHFEHGHEYRYYLFNDPPDSSRLDATQGARLKDSAAHQAAYQYRITKADPLAMEYLEKTIALCQEKGINLILVRGPFHPQVDDFADRSASNQTIRKLMTEHDLVLLDYAELFPNDDAFFNLNHTKSEPSRHYSTELAKAFQDLNSANQDGEK